MPHITESNFPDFTKIVNLYATDPSSAVREKAIEAAAKMLGSSLVEYKTVKAMVTKLVKELMKNKHYIYRVTAAGSFMKLKDKLKEKDLGDLFSAVGNELSRDKVANVKLSLLKSFIDIINKLPDSTRKESRLWISGMISDPDEDVQYFAEQAKDTK